jgi:glutamine amidotransferase
VNSVIVDYNSGNLHSARKSFQHVSTEFNKGEVIVSSRPSDILKADRIILPGVGSFDDCRKGLSNISDLFEAIEQRVIKEGYPFLGICVGHQMMATTGYENNCETAGFNWIPGDVVKISPLDDALKIPHMGWNSLKFDARHSLFHDISDGDHVYFVHSYHLVPKNKEHRISYTSYSQDITAAIIKDNIVGTQFHPEKSQTTGLTFIRNFLSWKP